MARILSEQAVAAIRAGFVTLQTSPFKCRKAGQSPFLRELTDSVVKVHQKWRLLRSIEMSGPM